MKSFSTLVVLLFMLLDPAWSGHEKELDILIEKDAAGEDVLEINGERIKLSEELGQLGVELQALVKGLELLGGEGEADQAFIGILLEEEETDPAGVNVIGITPDSPAQSAGILSGDIITGINGSSLAGDPDQTPPKKLFQNLKNMTAGEEVQLDLLRDGQQISISLTAARRGDHLRSGLKHLAELEKNMLHEHEADSGTSLDGVELYPLDKELGAYFGTDSGMLVLRAPQDKNLPIHSGDVIMQIGERSPASPSQTWRIFHSYDKGESIRLTLMRHGKQITLNMDKP